MDCKTILYVLCYGNIKQKTPKGLLGVCLSYEPLRKIKFGLKAL